MPEQEAGQHLRAVERPEAGRERLVVGRRTRRRPRRPRRPAPAADRSWRRATPTASSAAIDGDEVGEVPGAADRRRPPPDGAGREQDRRQRPHGEPDPQAAEHPPRDADADRGQGDGDRLLVGGQPEERDERQQHERRQRREREQDLAGGLAGRVEQRVDVLEVPVRRTVGAVGDGPVEGNLARAGTRQPARRSGCTGCSAGGWTTCTGRAPPTPTAARRRRPWRDRSGAAAAKGARRGPRLYSAPPSTLRERLPVTGLGSGAPGRDSTTDEAPRRGFGWQILAILAIALVFRLMMAYGFDALRGSGFDSDLDLFRFWADNLGKHGPFGFYDRGLLRRLHPGLPLRPVAGRHRRPAARRRRRPDQAAGDHHGRRPRADRLRDGPRPRRRRAALDDRRGRRGPQPDHLVRLGGLGPGRQLRHRVPAALGARAVEGAQRARRRSSRSSRPS